MEQDFLGIVCRASCSKTVVPFVECCNAQAGSKAYLTRHCQVLSAIVGTFRMRFVPSFFGIGISRSLLCFHVLTLLMSFSLNLKRSIKVRDALPSTPAVFLPAFN